MPRSFEIKKALKNKIESLDANTSLKDILKRLTDQLIDDNVLYTPNDGKRYVRKGRIWVEDTTVWGEITGTLSNQTDLQAQLTSLQNQINAFTITIDRGLEGNASFTNSTTLTLIDDFTMALAPKSSGSGDKVYALAMQLVTDGNTAGDFKFSITRSGLSSAELLYASDLDATNAATSTWSSVINVPTNGLGQKRIGNWRGFIRIPDSSSEGEFQFSCAQQTLNAQPSTLNKGSYIRLMQIL